MAYDDILHHNGPATFDDNNFPAVNMPLKGDMEDRNSNVRVCSTLFLGGFEFIYFQKVTSQNVLFRYWKYLLEK